MKTKINKQIGAYLTVVMVLLMIGNINGQAASTTWALTSNPSVSNSGNVSGNTATLNGVTASATAFNASGWGSYAWTTSSSYNTSEYYEFSLSPSVGYNLSISSFQWTTNYASGYTSIFYKVYYSTNNFSSSTLIGSSSYTTSSGSTDAQTISSLAINVSDGSTIKIRVYYYYSDGTTSGYYVRCKSAIVSGTTSSSATAPTVTTTAISSIATTSETSGGNITSIGTAAVTVSGICWNTSTNPTTANSKTTDGATSATSFASNLSSLSGETYYYVRAYATNSVGTSYGSNVAFYTYSTEPTGHSATFTASAASGTEIDLTFTAASTYGADGYIILRLSGATAPDNTNINDGTAPGSLTMPGSTVLVTTITSNATTTYANTGLSPNTQYSYAIIPYNYDGTNGATYNYRTSATIPTCNATTPDAPSAEGFVISGGFVNNGTFDHSGDINYFAMTGSSKSITGSGTYTSAKMNVNGTITFNATISSGSFSKTFVQSSKTYDVAANKTFINGTFTNYGTTTLNTGCTFKNSGDWTNNSTVSAVSTSTAEFNGSSAQNINGSASTTFSNLKINNSSTGVSMGINTLVNNTLTLTAGLLKTVSYTLTVGTNGTNGSISGGSSSTYIVAYDNSGTIGYVKQFINLAAGTAYSYPIGDATNYVPLTFTLTSGTLSSAYLTSYTKPVKVPGLNSSITHYINRFWDINPSGITSPTYTVAYTYVDGDITGGTEVGMLPVKRSGSSWYKPTGSTFTTGTAQGTGSVNAGTNTLTWSSLTTFSDLGGAVDGAVGLPIELVSFTGKKDGANNQLNWATASEKNNDFFTIEKTIDGENYEIVGNQDGAGSSNTYIEYMITYYNV